MTIQAASVRVPPIARPRQRHTALVLGLLGAAIGMLGSWIPSYWGDEAASVMSASRPLPSLLLELSTVDAVHGVYYAFLHVWMNFFGTSEFATRAPSAIAVGVMVSGTVVLVRTLAGSRTALIAGAVLIVLPRTMWMATEARSYAFGAAAAVWVTILLLQLLRRRIIHPAGWLCYGIAVAASVYLFLYLGLLLLVHAVVVVVTYRSQLRGWIRGAGVAALLCTPIVVIGYLQREQIAFLARRNYATAANALIGQWFDTVPVAIVCWALIVIAVISSIAAGSRHRPSTIVTLCAAWLVIPSAVLLIGNATVAPMYNLRYLTFCTPAAAILIASGIVALSRRGPRIAQRSLAAALIIVLSALCAPSYLAQRSAFAKDGGSDLRQVAEYVGAHARAGDAIIFDRNTKPSRDPRLALRLYPSSFASPRDIALVTAFEDRAGLWDTTSDVNVLDLTAEDSVWAVELPSGHARPADVTVLERRGFHVDSSTLIHRSTVYHLTRMRP